jgi:putative SOS response-associated peptidase YedK
MCGRLNIHNSKVVQMIMERAGLPPFPSREARYNICPTASLDVITQMGDIEQQTWSIEFGNFRHPNTKVTTLHRRKHLQRLLLEQRCVVPLNRFYEWPDAKERPKYKGIKTRFCISNKDDVIFLAGITKAKDDGTTQFNILTTEPNDIINDFHHRMPVWLGKENVKPFLMETQLSNLYEYLVPYGSDMEIYECDPYVNYGKHEGAQCMKTLRTWGQFQQEVF